MYVFESFIFCDAYVTYLAGCLPCLHHFTQEFVLISQMTECHLIHPN